MPRPAAHPDHAADPAAVERAALRRGRLLGLLGVAIFAMTLPMTRLALRRAGLAFAHGRAAGAWWPPTAGCCWPSAAVGYVAGARVSAVLPAQQVICWVLVGSLPLTLPAALWVWPEAPVRASAWAGFAYTAVFSMWLGFFAWYRGLTLGGVVRVSQAQLLQPFLALLFAVPVLGERLDGVTVLFSLAVVGVVFLGRRMLAPARTKLQLVKAVARYLSSVQRQPERIKSFFQHAPIRYAG